MNTERVALIRARLQEAFAPEALEIHDDSHRHVGHPGAASGAGHFSVHIVSDRFTGKKLLERHRMVYEALGPLLRGDIHALSITALSPDQT